MATAQFKCPQCGCTTYIEDPVVEVRCPDCKANFMLADGKVGLYEVRLMSKPHRQLLCKVLDRNDITGEPSKLEVVMPNEFVDLDENNQFTILYAPSDVYSAATGKVDP